MRNDVFIYTVNVEKDENNKCNYRLQGYGPSGFLPTMISPIGIPLVPCVDNCPGIIIRACTGIATNQNQSKVNYY
jgi:hypothetical protein